MEGEPGESSGRIIRISFGQWRTMDTTCGVLGVGARSVQKHVKAGDVARRETLAGVEFRLNDTPWTRTRLRITGATFASEPIAPAEEPAPESRPTRTDREYELELEVVRLRTALMHVTAERDRLLANRWPNPLTILKRVFAALGLR